MLLPQPRDIECRKSNLAIDTPYSLFDTELRLDLIGEVHDLRNAKNSFVYLTWIESLGALLSVYIPLAVLVGRGYNA